MRLENYRFDGVKFKRKQRDGSFRSGRSLVKLKRKVLIRNKNKLEI